MDKGDTGNLGQNFWANPSSSPILKGGQLELELNQHIFGLVGLGQMGPSVEGQIVHPKLRFG